MPGGIQIPTYHRTILPDVTWLPHLTIPHPAGNRGRLECSRHCHGAQRQVVCHLSREHAEPSLVRPKKKRPARLGDLCRPGDFPCLARAWGSGARPPQRNRRGAVIDKRGGVCRYSLSSSSKIIKSQSIAPASENTQSPTTIPSDQILQMSGCFDAPRKKHYVVGCLIGTGPRGCPVVAETAWEYAIVMKHAYQIIV
jgi:hypothetical protein